MPKRISEQELDAIVAFVAARPEGVRIGDILEGLPAKLEKRTLQRRLALLVEYKRLIAEGQGKSCRYRVALVAAGGSIANVRVQAQGRGEAYIPLSPASADIKQAIRAPLQNRQPVGY